MALIKNVSTKLAGLALLVVSAQVVSAQDTDNIKQSLPEKWNDYGITYPTADQQPTDWWKSFNDEILDSLIERGIDNNYNLDVAARRIKIASYNVRNAMAAYSPNIALGAGWSRSRNSGMTGDVPGNASTGSYWNLGLSMSWEVDLFGKITSSVKQNKSLYKASKAEYDGAMLTLAANIANDYVQLRVWQAQREVAVEHIERQLNVVKLVETRYECGLGDMLEVTQAREVYYSTVASIPNLENGIRTMINAIATLIGVYPDDIRATLEQSAKLPEYRFLVPAGIPADLLRRRPDIIASQNQLEAYATALGIAKKDFLPTLTINGSIGTSAHNAGDLFDRQSFTYSIAPTLSWTLFDGLSRNNNVAIAREQLQMGIDDYNFAIMTAIQDVDNAQSAYKSTLLQIDAVNDVLQQSDKSLSLSLDLYKNGLTQFSNVVDAQKSVLSNQNTLIVARGDAIMDIIKLYEALGGNWIE
ncbi:MAG: efflux transporter outer membrane subunit [Muribaculaceae bacterium]|nr:efflux transporter outer membrane subunit [Muribaculaceae bacterium]